MRNQTNTCSFERGKQNQQTSGQAHQEKKQDPNNLNKKWKRRNKANTSEI